MRRSALSNSEPVPPLLRPTTAYYSAGVTSQRPALRQYFRNGAASQGNARDTARSSKASLANNRLLSIGMRLKSSMLQTPQTSRLRIEGRSAAAIDALAGETPASISNPAG